MTRAATVLIIDDNRDDVELLRRRLQREHVVLEAYEGTTGLALARGRRPDLILLDLRLPRLGGVELLSRLREELPDSSVVVMTAYGSEELAIEVMKRGADDYLIKPLSPSTLAGIVAAAIERNSLRLEKRRLERELRAQKEYLEKILASSVDAIVTTDTEGHITFFSRGAEEIFRLSAGEAAGRPLADFLPKGTEEFLRLRDRLVREGKVANFETDFMRADGERLIALLSGSLLKDEAGEVLGHLAVIKDITRSIRLEREIYESKIELEAVFDAIADPLALIRDDHTVARANRPTAVLAGCAVTETVGRACYVILHGGDAPCDPCPIFATYASGERASAELVSTTRGETYQVTSYPVWGARGELKGVIEHRRAITEQRRLEGERHRLELELMERHKLSSIGMLVQGVAHNLNTPLGVILGRSELLRADLAEARDLAQRGASEAAGAGWGRLEGLHAKGLEGVEVIMKQVEAMSSIIQNMMHKSRQEQETARKRMDLNQVLEGELQFLESDMFFKHEITKSYDFDPHLPYVEGIYSDFSQAFTNIIRNAVDAMYREPRKELTIRTRHDDRCIYIEIHDTGEGISPENLPRIFDPFFTTKTFGEAEGRPGGVGLGLHSCYQLLTPYGVTFDVRSHPGDTAFTVRVPYRGGSGGDVDKARDPRYTSPDA